LIVKCYTYMINYTMIIKNNLYITEIIVKMINIKNTTDTDYLYCITKLKENVKQKQRYINIFVYE